MTEPVDVLAAIEMILTIHDGMQRMVREDGLPAEAIEPAHGFLAALADAGYVVVRAEDVRVARHAIVQASINLANGDTVSAQGDIEWALAALAAKETP